MRNKKGQRVGKNRTAIPHELRVKKNEYIYVFRKKKNKYQIREFLKKINKNYRYTIGRYKSVTNFLEVNDLSQKDLLNENLLRCN